MPHVLQTTAAFDAETREVLRIDSGESHTVGATLHAPADEARAACAAHAVLLLPGWSGPRTGPAELLVDMATRLARAGHLVLRIDLHGRGDSSGTFEAGDLDRMIADAEAGLLWLKDRAPGATLVAGGICSGGNVALGLASLRPEDIQKVAVFSVLPFQTSRGADLERRRRWKNVKALVRKAADPGRWLRLLRGEVNVKRVTESVTGSEKKAAGERNLKDSARDIEADLLAWKGQGLFVWGGGDEEAPPSKTHFEKLHAEGCGAAARFEVVAGANHNFYGKAWRTELAQKVLAFCA